MKPPFDAAAVLDFNMFEGDYGDGERVLRNVIGKNRKSFDCQLCADTQAPGGWAKMLTEAGPDGVVTYRWCASCCRAMDVYESDDGRTLNARQAVGDATRKGENYETICELECDAMFTLSNALHYREAARKEVVFAKQ